ncbi:lipopolysaccharide export system ATP-binding protein LptB [Variibacter gotjawalensis]|uniref:Lipopolysaccharide export system ATP-binding protein LptB n=1 Tax=Variibacter gotjawalensis TaxID=1333996 RepID=A0A0S3Q168_9BRAD|nr:ABC transporter ATP-binding protein [Variibacter gotjawalensis]NIK47777.1 branched-chain amino acid transport system ATP-binding protein [Variibacter gotjawalensis]RZS49664.1 amino acid/amide ABC transporter ATP-binding protein 1 (HAAT family) [Variibacter gotjawalensis]BAT61930.1 lipopolysaccharide export system ATP-binding protein LptB [Variibacter gotjawalensis]
MSLLRVDDIGISFGGLKALDAVSFVVEPGEIFALIGPNGAGKTTLFNIISGVYRASRGKITLGDEDVTQFAPHLLARRGMSRTFQNLQVFFRMTAAENVMVGRHLQEKRNVLAHLFALPSVAAQNRETRAKAEELLALVGLAKDADRTAQGLPYGALKRLEIARALASEPRILLLDEPAAGCNAVETEEIDAVIQKIAKQGVAVVLVEHDMRLVMKISNRIHVLEGGRTLASGTASEVRQNPAVIAAYLGKARGEEAADAQA